LTKRAKGLADWFIKETLDSRGGQADVYIAFNERSDPERRRPYVLKVPFNRKRAARHRDEVEAALKLTHPGIVKPEYYGIGDPAFLATPYYSKGHLKPEHIQGLSPGEKLRFFAKLCDAVGYAHEKHVVHRDIKPANVLVSDEGEPLLTDFGICWFQDEEPGERATATMEQVGPRFYMAPELADGRADPDTITPAVDVYSLGKLLYWMFAGTIFDREKHKEPRYDLREKEPRVAHKFLYMLLDSSIVEEPRDRVFQTGSKFAVAVRSTADILDAGGHVPDLTAPQPCSYCQAGKYAVEVDPRWWEPTKYGLSNGELDRARDMSQAYGFVFQAMWPRLVLRCDHCGHVQTFQFSRDARAPMKNWTFPKGPSV
jgi:serine/threonine protein kinase